MHYLSPSDDSRLHARSLAEIGVYRDIAEGPEHIIVATVNSERVAELVATDRTALRELLAIRP